MRFFPIQEDLYEGIPLLTLLRIEEDELDVRRHRGTEGLEPVHEVVRILRRPVEAVQVHDHLEGHNHVVVPVAEMRAALAGRERFRGLRHHVVHDGRAGRPIGMILAEPLIIVRFPEGGIFLHGKEIADVDPDVLRQAVHPRHEHVQVEEYVVRIPVPQRLVGILEETDEHILVIREMAEEELFGTFRIREHLLGPLVLERVRALVGPRRLHVHHSLVLIDFRLGRQAGKGRAARGHTHDGADRRRGTGVDGTSFPEYGRIVFHHRLRNRLMLVPADLGQVAHPVLHIVPEGFQVIQQALAPLGQVSLFPAFGQHVQDNRVGVSGIGIPGAVPAVMADINGLIALRNGRKRLG